MPAVALGVLMVLAAGAAPTRTDPSTWSKFGALDVKFGMGLGDVLTKYPNASVDHCPQPLDETAARKARFAIPSPLRRMCGESTILERAVFVWFEFLDGRLLRVRAGPRGERWIQTVSQSTEWRAEVASALREKYGPPQAAPADPRDLPEDLDEHIVQSSVFRYLAQVPSDVVGQVDRWIVGQEMEVRFRNYGVLEYSLVELAKREGERVLKWNAELAGRQAELKKRDTDRL